MKRKAVHSHSNAPSAKKNRGAQSLADPSSLPPRAVEGIHRTVVGEVKKGDKNVFRTLKKAQTFETRKIIKRVKQARDKNDAALTTKLESELAACKALSAKDLDHLAGEHVLRTLGKRKRVIASMLWPKELVIPPAPDIADKARANVVARMFGTAAVKEAVTGVVDKVEMAMGLKEVEVKKEKIKDENSEEKEKPAKKGKIAVKEKEEGEGGSENEVILSDGDRVMEESEEFAGFSDAGHEGSSDEEEAPSPANNARKSEDLDEDALWDRLMDPTAEDFKDLEERIGTSDSEAEEEEEGGEDVRDELQRTDDEWSGSEADSAEEEEKAPAPPQKAKEKKEKKEKAKPMSAASSQFLPSLMAGYVSGGDSDPDADWYEKQGKKRGPPEKKQRKNRMGQQARQALWEKKFGARANHVKKQEEQRQQELREKAARKAAWLAKRRGGNAPAGDAEGKKEGKEKKEEGPLHPSWEAARKAKEKQAQVAAALAKPQGKKITFD